MKRTFFSLLFAGALTVGLFQPVAAEDDFSDTSYWNNLCTNTTSLSESEESSCAAYMKYMQENNASLQEQIAAIDARKDEINANIASYASEINAYNSQISGLNGMIEDLNMQIRGAQARVSEIQERIQLNEEEITSKEAEIESLQEKVQARMIQQQETMRTNSFIDILMGAETFSEFIRIADALSDIYQYDSKSLSELNQATEELVNLRASLAGSEQELVQVQTELENGRASLYSQQASLLASKYEAELITRSYQEQLQDADSQLNQARETISANQSAIDNVNDSINESKNNRTTPTPVPSSTPEPSSAPAQTDPAATAVPQPSSTPSATPAATPDSNWSVPTVTNSSGNPYYGGWSNCVWGAWQLVYETLGIALPDFGYSTDWLANAQRLGYSTGSEPRVNSVAVYINHVAFVTAVNGDQVYIKEGNYLGMYYERWVPASGLPYTGQTCLGYIYLP